MIAYTNDAVERGEEAIDVDPGRPLGDDEEGSYLENEDRDSREDQRVRCDQRQNDGPNEGVEQRHEDDGQGGRAECFDAEAAMDQRRERERRCRNDDRDQQSFHERERATPPLPEQPGLHRVEVEEASQAADYSRVTKWFVSGLCACEPVTRDA